MHRTLLAHLALALVISSASAQDLPVLEARSPVLDVEDGGHLWKGLWTADPSLALDVYHAKRSGAPRTITFTSDSGSLALAVEPGKDTDFVVRLADGRACRTRISTQRQPPRRSAEGSPGAPVTIPFRRENGWMIVEARVAGSEPLDLMFDTGADNLVLHPSAVAKGAKLAFDGSLLNAGLGGAAVRRTSSDNRLEIAGMTWERELVLFHEVDNDAYDGILGYVAFEDAVLEIDPDRGVLVLHAKPPADLAGFASTALRYQGTLFAVETGFDTGTKTGTGWFVFDTGSSATLHLNQAFGEEHGLPGALDVIGTSRSRGTGPGVLENEIVLLPGISFGPHQLADVPAHLEVRGQDKSFSTGNLLGMQVLERFHAVLDFQNDRASLRPSQRFGEPFEVRRGPPTLAIAGVAAVLVAALAGWLRSRSRHRRAA